MRKLALLPVMSLFVLLFSGCGQQPTTSITPPPVAKKAPANAGSTGQSTALETTAPNPTNDLPTAIDETEKDLQMIDNDLKEVNQLDMNEEGVDF